MVTQTTFQTAILLMIVAVVTMSISYIIVRRTRAGTSDDDSEEGAMSEATSDGSTTRESGESFAESAGDTIQKDTSVDDLETVNVEPDNSGDLSGVTIEHTNGEPVDDFDDARVIDDIEEIHTTSLAPANIQTDEQNHEYIRTGKDTYIRSYFVTGWPEAMDDGQLQDLFSQSGLEVDVSIYIDPVPTEDALNNLKEEIKELEATVQLLEEDGDTVEARDKRQELNDYRGMRNTVRDSGAELFDVGFYCSIVASSEDELDRRSSELEDMLVSNGFTPTVAKKSQTAGHKSVSPIWNDKLEFQQSMMSAAIGGMFPFSSANLIKEKGIPIGEHAENGSPVIYDRFEHDRGYNFLTIGNIGAGKSFSTKLHLLRRRLYDPDTIIVMLDPLQGFAGLTSALNGKHVTVGGDTGLNPLEIKAVPQEILENNDELNPGRAKLKDLKSFFESFHELQGDELGKKWNTLQKALRTAYEQKGIDLNNPSTHHRESPTIQDDLIPILVDMVVNKKEHSILNEVPGIEDEELEELFEDAQQVTDKERQRASDLLLSMQAFLEGNALANLGSSSNFDFGDEEVIWLDLQQQEGRGSLGLMMNLLFSAVYERAKSSDKKIIFAIDEARYIMRDKSALEFLEQAVRHSRHYDLSIQFITQTIDEFFQHDEAKAIADQCDHKMFFHTEGLDEEIASMVNMNSVQAQFARNATPGDEDTGYSEAVFGVADEGWYPIHIRAMDEEATVVDMNPQTEIEDALPGMAEDQELPARVRELREYLLGKQVTGGNTVDPTIPEKQVETPDGTTKVADPEAMIEDTTLSDVLEESLTDGGEVSDEESGAKPTTTSSGGIDASDVNTSRQD